jgi:hypothetical protein
MIRLGFALDYLAVGSLERVIIELANIKHSITNTLQNMISSL